MQELTSNEKGQMRSHEFYEELCAQVATERATEVERSELNTHLRDCPECSALLTDLTQLTAQVLPLHRKRRFFRMPTQHRSSDSFFAYGKNKGLNFHRISEMPLIRVRPFNQYAWASIVFVIVALSTVAFRAVHDWELRRNVGLVDPRVEQRDAPREEVNRAAHGLVHESNSTVVADEVGQPQFKQQELEHEISRLKEVDREKEATSLSRLDQLQREAENSTQALSAKEAEVASLRSSVAELQKSLENERLRGSTLAAELDRQRQVQPGDLAELVQSQNELRELRAKVAEDQRLLAASAEIRDLVTARNLHLIDVHDHNGAGQKQRPFGRIFYTEGHQLIFYAYDLEGHTPGDLAFYVWGEQLGGQDAARNLGVLRVENAAAGRWSLTFDDPRVLARIDNLFVTAESAKQHSDRPRGERILQAFLDGRPNHP
jgi:hypothetical protein